MAGRRCGVAGGWGWVHGGWGGEVVKYLSVLVTGSTDRSKPEEAEPVGTRMLFYMQLVQKWTQGLFSLDVVAFVLRFNR